jgi:hypothetical protein
MQLLTCLYLGVHINWIITENNYESTGSNQQRYRTPGIYLNKKS